MNPLVRGLAVAGVHLALVASLGGKLLLDRQTQPRFWLRAAPSDPDSPLRGRYLVISVDVPAARSPREVPADLGGRVHRGEWLSAVRIEPGNPPRAVEEPAARPQLRMTSGLADDRPRFSGQLRLVEGQPVVQLSDPLAYFVPEHAPDPLLRPAGEELWVEVTLPRKGPLRPIRLGVRRGRGEIEPLAL